jgi:TRAP-type C4-dicarboxylate transport system permease small subunit
MFMSKLIQWITSVLRIFLIILMAVIVLDVIWQVFTRFILKNPSSFTEELAGFLLIWIGLLGASYAFYTRVHLGIDVLTANLRGLKKQVVDVSINLIVFLFALFILFWGGLRLVNLTFTLNQISPGLGIQMGYVYLVLPVTGILIMIYSMGFLISSIKRKDIR